MLFPEGARSPDGAMRPFKRGVWLLLTRAKCPILPVAVEGAFDIWPRSRSLPAIFRRRIAIAIGEPIPFDVLAAMEADAGLAHLTRVVDGLRMNLRRDLRDRTRDRYPPPGPADQPFGDTATSPE
jgi:1-acyl-sn-glycerol-3-phosphate acyltransferase